MSLSHRIRLVPFKYPLPESFSNHGLLCRSSLSAVRMVAPPFALSTARTSFYEDGELCLVHLNFLDTSKRCNFFLCICCRPLLLLFLPRPPGTFENPAIFLKFEPLRHLFAVPGLTHLIDFFFIWPAEGFFSCVFLRRWVGSFYFTRRHSLRPLRFV